MTGKKLFDSARRVKLVCVDVDGTLTDGGMYYSAQGEVMKRFDTRDAMGLALLRKIGVAVAIISSEDTDIVTARARKLDIKDVFPGVKDKYSCVKRLLEKKNLRWDELAFIGDDVNDHAVLKEAGFSACPADAQGMTDSIVKYVCKRTGGHGAVREVCDLIISAKNTS